MMKISLVQLIFLAFYMHSWYQSVNTLVSVKLFTCGVKFFTCGVKFFTRGVKFFTQGVKFFTCGVKLST